MYYSVTVVKQEKGCSYKELEMFLKISLHYFWLPVWGILSQKHRVSLFGPFMNQPLKSVWDYILKNCSRQVSTLNTTAPHGVTQESICIFKQWLRLCSFNSALRVSDFDPVQIWYAYVFLETYCDPFTYLQLQSLTLSDQICKSFLAKLH